MRFTTILRHYIPCYDNELMTPDAFNANYCIQLHFRLFIIVHLGIGINLAPGDVFVWWRHGVEVVVATISC